MAPLSLAALNRSEGLSFGRSLLVDRERAPTVMCVCDKSAESKKVWSDAFLPTLVGPLLLAEMNESVEEIRSQNQSNPHESNSSLHCGTVSRGGRGVLFGGHRFGVRLAFSFRHTV